MLQKRAIALDEWLGGKRQEKIGRHGLQRVAKEARWRYPDDREWLAIDVEFAAYHRWIESIRLLPNAIAHDRCGRCPRFVIRHGQRPSRVSAHAKHREIIARYEFAKVALSRPRVVHTPNREEVAVRLEGRHFFKALRLVPKMRIQLIRHKGIIVAPEVSAFDTGSDLSRMACTREKMEVVAPIPRASVKVAVTVNTGALRNRRSA